MEEESYNDFESKSLKRGRIFSSITNLTQDGRGKKTRILKFEEEIKVIVSWG